MDKRVQRNLPGKRARSTETLSAEEKTDRRNQEEFNLSSVTHLDLLVLNER